MANYVRNNRSNLFGGRTQNNIRGGTHGIGRGVNQRGYNSDVTTPPSGCHHDSDCFGPYDRCIHGRCAGYGDVKWM